MVDLNTMRIESRAGIAGSLDTGQSPLSRLFAGGKRRRQLPLKHRRYVPISSAVNDGLLFLNQNFVVLGVSHTHTSKNEIP